MDAEEIQEFSTKMKEANDGESSLTNISLAISILAVLVAMVTVLGHRSHTEALLAQTREGDQWSQYQSKKIRSDQVSSVMDLLSLQPNSNGQAVERKLKEYQAHLDQWSKDLAAERAKAKEFENEVAVAEKTAQRFDLGEALLQIAVVLCSITLFTRRKLYFAIGLVVGVIGFICALSTFLIH